MNGQAQDDAALFQAARALIGKLGPSGHAVYGSWKFDAQGAPVERVLTVHLHPSLAKLVLPKQVGAFRVEQQPWLEN